MLRSLVFETHANVFRCVMRGRKLLLLEVQSHAEMISPRATNPTYSYLIYWRNGLYLFFRREGEPNANLRPREYSVTQ